MESTVAAAHVLSDLHDINMENSSALKYEGNFFKRKVKEALLILINTSELQPGWWFVSQSCMNLTTNLAV